ncbi:hypothetical protein ACSNN7_09210 [Micromonospora sp. URMC 105]|uniref:hypothetical protein n=1 Tax=Micromonospora sp. URMC 105 TaxID=3423413 RepID=UPI003F195CDD
MARHRHRRRWTVEALTAAACLAVLVAYLGAEPEPEPRDGGVALPGAASTAVGRPSGPVGGPGQVAEAGVASPGLQPRQRPPTPAPSPSLTPTPAPRPATPLLTVSRTDVPAMVDLTQLGTRDWVHWGLRGPDSVVRKRGGSGEIRDEGGPGARSSYDTDPELFGWRDGAPVGGEGGTSTGIHTCHVGNGFRLAVLGSGELRTVHVFAGLWMARGRLDVRLSSGGPTSTLRVEDPHTNHSSQFVVRFRVAAGQKLLISWTAEETFNGCGNVALRAVALR